MIHNAGTLAMEPDFIEEIQKPFQKRLFPIPKAILGRLINTDEIDRLCRHIQSQPISGDFCHRLLQWLNVSYNVSDQDLARIPVSGPLAVVANHPFGVVEGLVLASVLRSVRPDIKILANSLLRPITALQNLFIYVDPFGGKDAAMSNAAPLRNAIRWLESGGVLATFPAGEVAHFRFDQAAIADPDWKHTLIRLARKMGLPVLNIHFSGSNSLLFQVMGLLHSGVRTALLAREMLNKRNCCIQVRIGSLTTPARLRHFKSDEDATAFLRTKTCLLRHRPANTFCNADATESSRREARKYAPIVPSDAPDILEAEIEDLGWDHILHTQGDMIVVYAGAWQIPRTLREIGRQREIAFRDVGEGTGNELDLDFYDDHYRHLFIWDKKAKGICGAYRIGHTNHIISRFGIDGLYAPSLFRISRSFFHKLGPALELGRAFVRPENQCDNRSLPLLWAGIVRYMARHPECRYLYGPVSISSNYQPVSMQLMARFLRARHPGRSGIFTRFHLMPPFQGAQVGRDAQTACGHIQSLDDLSDLIAEMEPDSKGVPALLRHYMRLGAKVLAFNIDQNFGNCLDALILVDRAGVNSRLIGRLLGKNVPDALHSIGAWKTPCPASMQA